MKDRTVKYTMIFLYTFVMVTTLILIDDVLYNFKTLNIIRTSILGLIISALILLGVRGADLQVNTDN